LAAASRSNSPRFTFFFTSPPGMFYCGCFFVSNGQKLVQDWLCIAATMLTTGALASLQRSLTDLPAATLLVGLLCWQAVPERYYWRWQC